MTDPRIAAVVRIVTRVIHADPAVGDGDPNPAGCKGCREIAVEILAAADAVDPLRADD